MGTLGLSWDDRAGLAGVHRDRFLPVYIAALGLGLGWVQFQGQQAAEAQRAQDAALQASL